MRYTVFIVNYASNATNRRKSQEALYIFVATDFMLVGANELWCIIDSFGHTRICLVQIFPLRKVIETFGISWSIQIFRFIIKLDVWSRVADLLIDFFCSPFCSFAVHIQFSLLNSWLLLISVHTISWDC